MIAVVFATIQEAQLLLNSLPADRIADEVLHAYRTMDGSGLIVICGMGRENASNTMRVLLDRYPVNEVINAGAAGALANAPTRSLHRITEACDGDAVDAAHPIALPVNRFAGIPGAALATVSEPVFDSGRRARLGSRAALVDMEGFAVASACRDRNIPCSLLKGVTDNADSGGRSHLQKNLSAVCELLADAIAKELGWPRRKTGALALFTRFVRIEHTVFSIPLILAGAWLGAGHAMPSMRGILLLTLVGTGARTMGMALNRIFDRDLDAVNPRTRGRDLPSGRLGLAGAYAIAAAGLAMYVGGCAALGPMCLYLAPVPAIPLLAYSLLKRFTNLCHFGIGLCLALGPAGAYVATSGELPLSRDIVLLSLFTFTWISAFDIIYALQDIESDRAHGVHSLPAGIGAERAQVVAALIHLLSASCAAALWVTLGAHILSAVAMLVTVGALAAAYWKRLPLTVRFFPVSAVAGIGGAMVVLLGGMP